MAAWVGAAVRDRGVEVVALAGGCFFNAILRADLSARLQEAGMRVIVPTRLLPGDTAIALGQAVIARSTLAGDLSPGEYGEQSAGRRPLTEVS